METNENKVKEEDMKVVRNKIYEFNVDSLNGPEIKFQKFKGKKILIVNLPTACDYSPQYEQLQRLSKKYEDNLIVIGFPAKNFGREEPATGEPIMKDCVEKYGLTFPIAKNISKKDEDIHPIYKWLLSQHINEEHENQVSYNFQKYLIDQFGKLVAIFPSGVDPMDKAITEAIEKDFYQQSYTLQ